MRGPQLRQITAPHLLPEITSWIAVLPPPRLPLLQSLWARTQPAGTIFWVTKPAIRRLLPETAHILRRRGCRICFDPVDSLPQHTPVTPDVFVASSYSQARLFGALEAAGNLPRVPVATVLHNADARFYVRAPEWNHNAFRAAYFGLPKLTRIPLTLQPEVTVFSAGDPANVDAAMSQLAGFSLHYACRSDTNLVNGIVKPFTKGVTAAVLGANVMTGSDVPDAIELLGADYPYLVPNSTDQEIIETFSRARSEFGGPNWTSALQRMRFLAEMVSPHALALQIRQLVSELDG